MTSNIFITGFIFIGLFQLLAIIIMAVAMALGFIGATKKTPKPEQQTGSTLGSGTLGSRH